MNRRLRLLRTSPDKPGPAQPSEPPTLGPQRNCVGIGAPLKRAGAQARHHGSGQIQLAPMKRLIGALAVAAILFTTGCGGDDDSFPEDEFVKQVTANGVTEDVARCTYDGIRDDADIMAELRRTGGPNDQISDAAARTRSFALDTSPTLPNARTTARRVSSSPLS